ncbi:MAG: argininosuccinate lyase [Actinobacteria bacterium]|nr:argininosuccinate lyase [Actinomycetota bacterium]MBM3712047.1 argininosuccinate lyase [Actinomycetota bacterium]
MEKNKIWKGRINKKSDILADKFTASIDIDKNLYMQDITGSAAYAVGLNNIGIISDSEIKGILSGLKEIKDKISSGKIDFEDYEDIHSLVEIELSKIAGESAGKIHTGRSRNDQIVLDEILFIKEVIIKTSENISDLQKILLEKSEAYIDTVFPAYTHMQKAQPVLVPHYLLSYFEKFQRCIKKLFENFESCDFLPLGAAACAGSGYAINSKLLKDILKFKKIGSNSMDITGSRDFIIDYIYSLSMIMLNLSRFCEDLIIYNSQEFSYVDIDESFCTGSSIMPQKKNPDILELIKGKSAVVTGNLVQILTLMKGLSSTYNRDMQEDKKILFSAHKETNDSLEIFTKVIKSTTFDRSAIKKSMESGFLEATDAADYLVRKGENFRSAHNIVGKIIKYCLENSLKLKDLPLEKLKNYSDYFGSDFYSSIYLKSCINSKVTECGTSTNQVKIKIKEAKININKIEKDLIILSKRIPKFEEIISNKD